MIIDFRDLSEAALFGVIDDFVLREGTDYGREYSLEQKRAAVLAQLQSGQAVVQFDPQTESVSIVPADG